MKAQDFTGQRFGMLEAISLSKNKMSNGRRLWLLRCDCGKIIENRISASMKKHCGCQPAPNSKDLTNRRFGKLVALKPSGTRNERCLNWLCECDCGNIIEVKSSYLFNSQRPKRDCGCVFQKRNWNGDGIRRAVYRGYELSAPKRGYTFNIPYEKFIELSQQPCHYCGASLSNEAKNKAKSLTVWKYNGLDRVDNSIGYEIDNVVPCCKMCNYGKHAYNKEEFLGWIKKVYEHTYKNC